MRQKLFSLKALKEALRDRITVKCEINDKCYGLCTYIVKSKDEGHPAFDVHTPDFSGVYNIHPLDFANHNINFYAIV